MRGRPPIAIETRENAEGFVEQKCADCQQWRLAASYRNRERRCHECKRQRDRDNRRSWGL